jgi:GT2 family glycosyltransferase
MGLQACAKLCVIIVSYGRPDDLRRCLASLARSSWTDFAVFVCENAGAVAFDQSLDALAGAGGLLEPVEASAGPLGRACGRLARVARYRLGGTAVQVEIGAATDNLGYGGGVNAWLELLRDEPGWEAVLVLNPDTEVEDGCLAALLTKAAEGYGMVGATLVFDDAPGSVISYGLRWSRLSGRVIAAGREQPAGSEPAPALLTRLDAISGACVLVTRAFVEEVGPMVEDYFLYMEDIDWGMRRGRHRIGFAARAVVRHVGGTAIGSVDPRHRSLLSIYLSARNAILFSRRWSRGWWVVHAATGLLYALRYLAYGSPAAAWIALAGVCDGVRGETGRPRRVLPAPSGPQKP